MPYPEWSWVLADRIGNPLCDLTSAHGKSLTFKRNYYSEASCSISHTDEAASVLLEYLDESIPTLLAYRKGEDDASSIIRFRGHLAPFTETLDENGGVMNLTFRSPLGRWFGDGPGRGHYFSADTIFTGYEQGELALTFVDLQGPYVGLARGTNTVAPLAILRTRYYSYANYGEALLNLSQMSDGFDFEEVPTDVLGPLEPSGTFSISPMAYLNVMASQGGDLSSTVKFEYGSETLNNVRSVERHTSAPLNAVQTLGVNGLLRGSADNDSESQYGVYKLLAEFPDISDTNDLARHADALKRSRPVKTITFAPDSRLAPKPWDDYWLGDTVSFYGRQDSFVEDVQARVNSITVAIDEGGIETFEIPSEEDTFHSAVADPFADKPGLDVEVV